MATQISEMVRTTGRATRIERFAAALFAVALVVPSIAFLLGARPVSLDNSAAPVFPALSLGALTGTETFGAIDRYLDQGLPGRDRAVRAYAGLDYQLLGGSTNRDVIPGVGDWLFFTGELRPTCARDATRQLAAIDSVADRAAADGIDFRFVVAPDKHGLYPDRLRPGSPVPPACTDAQRQALRAGFAARPGSTVDLWAPVEGARDGSSTPVYFAQDSHWTPDGAVPAIGALVASLAPGVWDPAEIVPAGTASFPMELARLIGIPRNATIPAYSVRPTMTVTRSTVPTTVHLTEAPDITRYRTTGDGEVVPGTTLVVYDSFFNIHRPRITPWFADTIWVHVGDLRAHPELVADLPPIDRIVVERVERSAYDLDLEGLLAPLLGRD